MSKAIKLLVVEDSEDDAKLVIRMLKRGGFDAQHERVQTAAAMEAALRRQSWDAVISDYNMPGFGGLDALRIVRSTGLDIPFILISGTVGEEIAVDAMKAGANDYIVKANLSRLASVLERELKETAIRAAHRYAQRALVESEQRYREMFSANPQPMWVFDPKTLRFLSVNDAAVAHYGWSREEFLAMTITDIRPAGEVQRTLSKVARVTNQEFTEASVWKHLKKDGTILDVETTSHVIDFGGQRARAVLAHDVTDRLAAERKLYENEAQLRQAQQIAKLAHAVSKPDGSFESWSETLPALVGIESAQLPKGAREWLTLLHPDDRALFRNKTIEAGENRMRMDIEYRLRRGDGAWIHIRHVIEPLREQADTAGRTRWFNTVQDVSEQKRDEDRIRRLNRIYAVLSGINAAIVRTQDRAELFREACRIVVEAGRLALTYICVVDAAEQRLTVVASAGAATGFMERMRNRLSLRDDAPEGHGPAARAVREKQAVVVNDVANDPLIRHKQEHAARGIRSVATLPLFVAGRPAGVLGLYAAEAGFFDEEEMRLLSGLAGDLSFALDNLEKAERLKIEAAERLRAEAKVVRLNRVYAVLSGINALIVRVQTKEDLYAEACRVAVESGQFRMAWLGLVDRQAMRVKPVAWHGTGADYYIGLMPVDLGDLQSAKRGLAARAVMERKAMISNDMTQDPRITLRKEAQERGFHSLAMLPLVVAEEVVGVLALYAGEVGFFDEEEMKLLHELAGDIAFALDHIEKANKLDYLAFYDSLTGLANRSLFHERLSQYLHSAQQEQGKLALILMDMVRFKTINDSLGRQAGDELLKQLAGRLGHAADPADIARIGGDHFAIVLSNIKGRSEISRTVEGIWRDCFAQPFRVNDTELRVSAKAGIALFPSDGDNVDTLFANAEAALQKAQETGERLQFHSREMTESVAGQLALENQLRQALEKEEFVLHYQPKVELETRRIVGVEALIRWQSPELGLVPPMKFIPLMEETGMILDVGAWALRRAAADHRRWVEQKLTAPRVAVNVSTIQLRQRDFVGAVEQAIMEGVAPTGIDLEITESLIMHDIEGNIRKLKEVRALGVRIAIDDFGTGYSSLGYLAKLPVQTLKIDRSFIITMLNDPDTMTLVQTMISLAHSLRLKVVAEGVDAEEQAKMLRLLRCDEMQGYLFSKPVPFEQMTALLTQGAKS